jgi:hypothetical protein
MMPLVSGIVRLMGKGRRTSCAGIALASVLLLPAAILVFLVLINYLKESKDALYQKKSSEARLASAIVEEKLNSLVALGRSYASRPLLVKYIDEDRWSEGLDILSEILTSQHGFERIVLYDTAAVIRADLPHANVIGQNRRDKEWYKEFSKARQPYVSGVYQRGADPKKNVICIVVPIRGNPQVSAARPSPNLQTRRNLGILQLQLDLDFFHSWAHFDVGRGGIIYIVDQYGRIVHHPKFERKDTIRDFTSVGIVAKMISGQNSGVVQNYNEIEREERLAGFQRVWPFGWGVVITQPVKEAFRQRNATLMTLIAICCLLFGLAIMLVHAIHQIILFQQKSAKELNLKNTELKKANDDLLDAIENIKTLKGLLPICAHCKKVRDDSGYWEQIETYVRNHSEADFTHGICPDCIKKHFPKFAEKKFAREASAEKATSS